MENSIIEKYLPIIAKQHPDITIEKVTLFDNGYDHYVLLVDNLYAFRFPITENNGKKDHVESIFLNKFAPLSPIPIAQMTSHADKATGIKYQTYMFIPGVSLSKEVAANLTEKELVSIATDMGKFLSSLHSFSVKEALEMGMESLISPQDYGEYFRDFLEKDKKAFFFMLSEDEQLWIEKSVEDFYQLTQNYAFEMKVIHSDIFSDHIIIDQQTHTLNGIIDFSLCIGDPANDFKYFDKYEDIFLKTVYENYLPVDEYFDARRKFYAENQIASNLYQSIQRKDKPKIELNLSQLKEHIALQYTKLA